MTTIDSQGNQHPDNPFILISGCPRSGTSAVAGWLKEQPRVSGFSETRILIAANAFLKEVTRFKALESCSDQLVKDIRSLVYRYYGGPRESWNYVVLDKEPLEPIAFPEADYQVFFKNIQLIFPNNKILFLVRNPISTVWSICARKWGISQVAYEPVSLDIDQAIDIWRQSASLIHAYKDVPGFYICRYEDLIESPEESSLRVLENLNLDRNTLFKPTNSKTPEFSHAVREKILEATRIERSFFDY